MRNYAKLLIVGLLCASCQWETQPVQNKPADIQHPDTTTPENIEREAVEMDKPMAYVVANTTSRQEHFDSTDFENPVAIDTGFLSKFIHGLKPGPDYKQALPKENWESYFWHQHYVDDSLFYFSIIYRNEYCCDFIYGITAAQPEFKIIDIHEIGLYGADGGWMESDYGNWISDTSIHVTKAHYYDEMNMNNSDSTTIHIDTIWMERGFNGKGKFYQTILDSSSEVRRVALN